MDLIDREALMSAVMAQDVVDKSLAKRLIIQAPTVDAVRVVRCGQCRYFRTEKCTSREDRWYCADGERREE